LPIVNQKSAVPASKAKETKKKCRNATELSDNNCDGVVCSSGLGSRFRGVCRPHKNARVAMEGVHASMPDTQCASSAEIRGPIILPRTFFDRFPQEADSAVSSDNAGGTAVKEMPLEGLQVAAGFVRRLLG